MIDVKLGEKVTSTLNARFESIYFSFSGPWPQGEAALIPVVDNVVGGEVIIFVKELTL